MLVCQHSKSLTSQKNHIYYLWGDIEKSLKAGEFAFMVLQFTVLRAFSVTGIMRILSSTLLSVLNVYGIEKCKMADPTSPPKCHIIAAPQVAITTESSNYPLVINIELPFYSLDEQFIIITEVFIGLVVQKALSLTTATDTKIYLICYRSLENHLEDIGTMQSSKPVLNT